MANVKMSEFKDCQRASFILIGKNQIDNFLCLIVYLSIHSFVYLFDCLYVCLFFVYFCLLSSTCLPLLVPFALSSHSPIYSLNPIKNNLLLVRLLSYLILSPTNCSPPHIYYIQASTLSFAPLPKGSHHSSIHMSVRSDFYFTIPILISKTSILLLARF